jgi:glutathionylspermidine synthase
MQRISVEKRDNWQEIVESQGLVYHSPQQKTYWDESAFYRFGLEEVLKIESATSELQKICLETCQYVIDNDLFHKLHIPEDWVPRIKESWEAEPPALYGRFDLAYNGECQPKLLEYNADTPTSLVEAAVVQWYWLQDRFPQMDQFNSLHEKLIAKWQDLKPYLQSPLYFAHVDDVEDIFNITYLRDTAEQAGISTRQIQIDNIGWNGQYFIDLEENEIRSVFKLYPWEWLVHEEFSSNLNLKLATKSVTWIEPCWKMLLSNKGILPILWERNPGHPNLLETYFEEENTLKDYCRKPLLSREGANVSLHSGGRTTYEAGGEYGEEGFICQALAPIPDFQGNSPVIGSWLIDQEPAGMGIRETSTAVTDNFSRFLPHICER